MKQVGRWRARKSKTCEIASVLRLTFAPPPRTLYFTLRQNTLTVLRGSAWFGPVSGLISFFFLLRQLHWPLVRMLLRETATWEGHSIARHVTAYGAWALEDSTAWAILPQTSASLIPSSHSSLCPHLIFSTSSILTTQFDTETHPPLPNPTLLISLTLLFLFPITYNGPVYPIINLLHVPGCFCFLGPPPTILQSLSSGMGAPMRAPAESLNISGTLQTSGLSLTRSW